MLRAALAGSLRAMFSDGAGGEADYFLTLLEDRYMLTVFAPAPLPILASVHIFSRAWVLMRAYLF